MNLPKFDILKIKLILALGNTGKEYNLTRHNAGFEFLDESFNVIFNNEKKLKSLISLVNFQDHKLLIAKPTTMMNSSGEAVYLIKNFFKLTNAEILIIHDDLDLLLGNFKIQFAKGPKIHNGIGSIENKLNTKDFWRLRLGIENRTPEERKKIPGMAYVLGKFKKDEMSLLNITFTQILEVIKSN